MRQTLAIIATINRLLHVTFEKIGICLSCLPKICESLPSHPPFRPIVVNLFISTPFGATQLGADLRAAAEWLLNPSLYCMLLAVTCLGLLFPIVSLYTALKRAKEIVSCGRHRSWYDDDDDCSFANCCGLLTTSGKTLVLWVALTTLPFVLVYKVVPANVVLATTVAVPVCMNATLAAAATTCVGANSTAAAMAASAAALAANATSAFVNVAVPAAVTYAPIRATLSAFLILLFVCVVVILLGLGAGGHAAAISNPSRFCAPNYQNALAVLSIALDAFQLISIPLTLLSTTTTTTATTTESVTAASGILAWVQTWSKNLLLFQQNQFEAVFWLSIALVVLWFFVAAAPPIGDRFFSRSDLDWERVMKSKAYGALVRFLSGTLFLPIIVNLLKSLQCAADTSVLVASPSMQCWQGRHLSIALAAMFALSFFLLTANSFGAALEEQHRHVWWSDARES
jgi:hypothetical protein